MPTNNQPLVSICIPTYNGESFIEETLRSAINQTYKNIEIIITDDHSTDNSLAICTSFAEKDDRIKIYKNNTNLGLVGNWCEVIKKASSNWIKYLFQDDLLEPECVEKMINCALIYNSNFVICNREYIFENEVTDKVKHFYNHKIPKVNLIFKNKYLYSPKEIAKEIAPHIFNNCIGEPPVFLFNKSHFSESDYPNNYFQLIDYIFVLNKILTNEVVFVNENLVKFRVHNSSESSKNKKVDSSNKKAFFKFIYVQHYEKIQICNEIINNPLFSEIKKHIPLKDILAIKKWYVYESYKNHGFKNVISFYKESKLSKFILDNGTLKYNYFLYKIFKLSFKKTRKKYAV